MFTTLFLIMCLVEGLLLILFLATEKIGYSFLSFLMFLAVMHFGWTGTRVDLIQAVLADTPRALGWFIGYLAVGAIYSVVRWYFRVRRTAKKMVKVDTNLQAALKVAGTPVPPVSNRAAVQSLHDEMYTLRQNLIPSRQKSLLVGWIAFFPLDAVAFLVEEPVQRIVRMLASTYTRISKAALEDQGLPEEASKLDKD